MFLNAVFVSTQPFGLVKKLQPMSLNMIRNNLNVDFSSSKIEEIDQVSIYVLTCLISA